MFFLTVSGVISKIQHSTAFGALTVKFNAFGVDHSLLLMKNNFLGNNFKAFHIDENNVIEQKVFHDCYYVGESAAFRSCEGLSGHFFSTDLNTTILIEPINGGLFNISKNATIFGNNWCSTVHNSSSSVPPPSAITLENMVFKRGTSGAIVELLVLGDDGLFHKYGNNTVQHVLDVVNVASSIYKSNSFLGGMQLSVSLSAVITFNQPVIFDYEQDNVLNQLVSFISDLFSGTKNYFNGSRFDYIRNVDHVTFLTAKSMYSSSGYGNDLTIGIADMVTLINLDFNVQ